MTSDNPNPPGVPKTEAQRRETHKELHGTEELPKRGTGSNNPGIYVEEANETIKLPNLERIKAMEYLANVQTVRVNSYRPYMDRRTGKITNDTSQDLDLFFKGKETLQYVITQISAWEDTTLPTQIRICAVRGGIEYLLNASVPADIYTSVDFTGQVILAKNDSVRVKFVGGTSADGIQVAVHGYTLEE